MKEVDSDLAFQYWNKGARKGERVVYYDGFLMRDREYFIRGGGFANNFPPKIKAAISAWDAYMNGSVMLVQKKVAAHEYQYIAIKIA